METSRLPHDRTLLLDGGLGRELRFRGVEIPPTIWSAGALMTDPEVVRQIHLDYIEAGADIITTNTYGIIRSELAKEGLEDQFSRLNVLAAELAKEARDHSGKEVLIAGSLPPLRGSYRADLVGPINEIEPLYREQAELLAPHVDLFICETMSSSIEGRSCARAAVATGKPVWVAWSLHEDRSGNLRSGESITTAAKALSGIAVDGVLANCCAPESITKSITSLSEVGCNWFGGYANTLISIPGDWTLDGKKKMDGALESRGDLSPQSYGAYVKIWLQAGATVVGGCCGTQPAHTAVMRQIIDAYKTS
jgi:S-methylmethionine-dependent homocysteine/selenocysteine methylase